MRKFAGILDTPKKVLSSDLWFKDSHGYHLFPHIRSQILAKAYSFVPEEVIKEIFIIGSITGYKYKETSDMDVNIAIEPYDEKYKAARHDINGFLAQGTRHPVNFYFTEYFPNTSREDSIFGVYDIVNNIWISPPPTHKSVRDPRNEFILTYPYAKLKAKQFELTITNLKAKLKTLTAAKQASTGSLLESIEIARYERNTAEAYQRLLALAKEIDEERKFEYYKGWGVPRKNYRNIVYKLIEGGPHGHLFEYLKEIKPKQTDDTQESSRN